MHNLTAQYCQSSETLTKLSSAAILNYLAQLPNWSLSCNESKISAKYEFKNFKQTIFFINAVAFICEQECHHPEITFGFNYCQIQLFTHDVDGISLNDFICAAKFNALMKKN